MKMLYVLSVLLWAGAGLLAVFSARQWSQGTGPKELPATTSLLEGTLVRGSQAAPGRAEITSPLVAQATAFALYLDPPKPPAPKVMPAPRVAPPPVARPPMVAPKFRVLGISYYHSHPEKSLAMVSEPGRGSYWIKPGDRVGHLLIERIVEGAVVYRDGGQLHEMKVSVRESPTFARIKSTASASPMTYAGRVADP